jgi:hypothetical protein
VAGTITAASGILADAVITNAKIADSTIQSAKIASLDAAKITTGFLDAARINTGSTPSISCMRWPGTWSITTRPPAT